MSSLLQKISVSIILLFILLLPFFGLTFLPSAFVLSKQLLLITVSIILAFLFFLRPVKLNSSLTLPLTIFLISITITLLVHPLGRLESILGRGSLYLGAAVLALLASRLNSARLRNFFITGLILSTTTLALFTLVHITWIYQLPSLPVLLSSRFFTPTGSPLTTIFLFVLGGTLSFFLGAHQHDFKKYLYFTSGTLNLLTLTVYLALVVPAKEIAPLLFPYQASWSILLEAFKNPLNIITGTGLSNFESVYTLTKPLFLNTTVFWNLAPASLSSEFFHLLLTSGIFSLLALLWLFLQALKPAGTDFSIQALRLAAALTLVSFIFLPASPVIVSIAFLLFALTSKAGTDEITDKKLAATISVGGLILVVLLSYYLGRSSLAFYHAQQSVRALAQGDGKRVYEEQLAAVRLLPRLSAFRTTYSRINLSLASSLAQKADLSDADRQQIAALVSQAVRESKAGVELLPQSSTAWQNLGYVYRNLIGVAEGADQFALTAYAQAIALDPGNPALRVDYGGLLYQLYQKDTKNTNLLSQAAGEFQTAVQLKPDYANGYYNLSSAFKSGNDLNAAYLAMQKAVASLDPTSPDLEKATKELEELKTQLPTPSPSPSASPAPDSPSSQDSGLTTPSPLPSPIDGGEIPLPSDNPIPGN